MDEDTKEELIEVAVENYLTPTEMPVNEFRRGYATRRLFSEEFSLDDMRVSSNDLMSDFMIIIQDIQIERDGHDIEPHFPVDESLDDDGLIEVFDSKVSDLYSNIMSADTITFTFYFPWNIRFEDDEEFSEIGVDISEIGESNWEEVVQRFRQEPDVFGVGNLESQITDGIFSFWKGEVEARGPDFAFSEVLNALRLVCAKLNFANYSYNLDYASERHDLQHRRHDLTSRWSEIQRPFGFLLKDHNGAHLCKVLDHEGRQPIEEADMRDNWRESYNQFPTFDTSSMQGGLLHDVLLTYQDAFEGDDSIDAFFKFWRALEELTHVGRSDKKAAIDRASYCIEYIEPRREDPFIHDIKKELWEVRNNWVHQSFWKRIYPHHEKVCKYLLDATIEFHISELDGIDSKVISEFYRFATMEESDATSKEEALQVLRDIE